MCSDNAKGHFFNYILNGHSFIGSAGIKSNIYLAWIVRGQREREKQLSPRWLHLIHRVMCCSPICALRCSLPLPPSVPLSLTWPISPRASERPTVRWRDGECSLASSQTKRHLAVFVAAAAAGGRERGCYAIPEFRCPSADAGGEFLMRPLFVLPVPGGLQLQGGAKYCCCFMNSTVSIVFQDIL